MMKSNMIKCNTRRKEFHFFSIKLLKTDNKYCFKKGKGEHTHSGSSNIEKNILNRIPIHKYTGSELNEERRNHRRNQENPSVHNDNRMYTQYSMNNNNNTRSLFSHKTQELFN
ncbi:unnamed protein product [Heterobilharzia americana]|nr:unnamed protein product [Heterobilharzia americana]